MKIILKIGIGILAVFGLVLIGLNIFAPVMFDCRVTPIRSTQSPNNQHFASIESKICNDSERNGTFLDVRLVDSRTSHQVKIFDNSTTDFELTWISDNSLHVIIPRGISLLAEPIELAGVRVRFRSR